MDYDLSRLGTREFEHLTQSFVLKLAGAKVSVFGDGADGGREATYDGKLVWPSKNGTVKVWDGYTVLQAKFMQHSDDTRYDSKWFVEQLARELNEWKNPNSARHRQGRFPQYLLLATNIRLSATAGGGVDSVNDLLRKHASDLGLKGWHVWDYAHICRLLDAAADIRKAYSGLITPGDILERLNEMLEITYVDLGEELRCHMRKDLLSERLVRLNQAGDQPGGKPLTLDQVAIDLSASFSSSHQGAIVPVVAHIVAHGNKNLRPSVLAFDNQQVPRRFVVVGGPGQGKSTLGQVLTQVYRVALLQNLTPGTDAAQAVTEMGTRLTALNIDLPTNLRWPIRVDLAQYAEAVSGGNETSFLRWLARRIKERGAADINATHLRSWLRSHPWLLVLDGLDEVTALAARQNLKDRLTEFFDDADDADLLTVVTTRPQGYGNEYSDTWSQELHLTDLTQEKGMHYAELLADVRHPDDDDSRNETLGRVKRAFDQPITARLMRTPLQVTIMSL